MYSNRNRDRAVRRRPVEQEAPGRVRECRRGHRELEVYTRNRPSSNNTRNTTSRHHIINRTIRRIISRPTIRGNPSPSNLRPRVVHRNRSTT